MDNRCDLQTVLKHGFAHYRQSHRLSPMQVKVCGHIEACRTEAMGGCHRRCDQCGYQAPHYHSCRDRHCPKCQSRACPGEVDALLSTLMKTDWVVYSKHCLTHTRSIVGYLARYSHRTAIGDQRITGFENGQVRFRYQDYRTGKNSVMSLDSDEFIRRFLLHVLPQGFMRIRHYGFLANCCRQDRLEQIHTVLDQPDETVDKAGEMTSPAPAEYMTCPKCRRGHWVSIDTIAPKRLTEGWPLDLRLN